MRDELNVSVRDGEAFYRACVTLRFAKRYNNYAMVSCGWTVDDDLPRAAFKRLQREGRLTPVSRETWAHSGCQSACVLRGAKECRW